MGKGRELGLLVKDWIASGSVDLGRNQALSNRLLDALGADEQLRTPLKDLAAQPLLKVVLQGEGAARSSALTALVQQLEPVYAPGVLGELVDLLEAATGLSAGAMGVSSTGNEPRVEPVDAPPGGDRSDLSEEPSDRLEEPLEEWVPPEPPPRPGSAFEQARLLGAGVALAAVASLVWRWGAAELDQWLFEPRDWNGGAVLLAVLLVVQILALGPLRYLRREWPLELMDAGDPRSAWRWITAPWIHHAHREAAVNLLALLLILGPSPLSPAAVIFRYALTVLATQTLALVVAQRRLREGRWDGASGAVSALIALGAASSLLHWRVFEYSLGPLDVPAWVLLVVYGMLQLGWQLPRHSDEDDSRPIDRLLSSQWFWGLVLGVGWAVVSRLGGLVEGLSAGGSGG